jgi:hypothetical protein
MYCKSWFQCVSRLFVLALPIAGAGCGKGTPGEEHLATHAAELSIERTIVLSTPKAMSVVAPVLGASSSLSFGAGANVLAGAVRGVPPVVSMGAGGLHAEPDVLLNDVWSRGPAELRDRVRVRGKLHAQAVTLGNGVVVEAGTDREPVFDPPETLTWKVTFPNQTAGDVNLEPDRAKRLAPGRYDTVRVASRATLTLGTGSYYVTNLQLEPDASVVLDQNTGPVVVYAATGLQLRGTFRATTADPPDLLLVSLGTSPVVIERAFDGALVAPAASLTLRDVSPREHRGFFSAKTLFIDAHAKVRYRAPLAVLTAAQPPLAMCAALVPLRTDLTGRAQAVQYQKDIARFCSMAGSGTCATEIAARTNVDFNNAAFALFAQTITPAQYLGLIQDRIRKERAADDNPQLAAQICGKPDGDGDLVPDDRDICKTTPTLTQTFDNGCTNPTLPPAPSAEDVHDILSGGGVIVDPRCSGAKMMPKAVAGAFYRPGNPAAGSYVIVGRVTNQPVSCPVWYMIDVEELAPTGPVRRYLAVFSEQEGTTSLVGLAEPVPTGFIQFNPLPTEAGSRGFLGSAGGRVSVRFRVRTMNGGGMTSDWSGWKFTTKTDCTELGFVCSS